ncbi:S-layer homology domain-containing protein [Paenibacillus sp. sgz302251]|uniref:S-layer homology domain-containing protein n=1 Tax=Paenibacillus sp. sgz302251 TaxID=3414493 RepID=UPI003C7B9911
MPLHFAGKKIVIGAIALSLVAGSGMTVPTHVLAATTAMSTPFTDISRGHWAEKHVAKLALQGIITGYTAGNTFVFRPSANVSQEEAILMALRFAGLYNQVNPDVIAAFPASFKVSNFFKPYVQYALSSGLLDEEEEYALADKAADKNWGTRPASREWVTKLMIRAINKDAEAVRLKSAASAFSDDAQIDAKYRGYVNAATQLELVKGVTPVKFDPKANVTRASLATLFSRAQKQFPVEYEGQTSGIVSKLTDTSLTLYHDKKETTYTLGTDTLYYHYNTETLITREQLLEYGDVTVISKDGKALYIEVMGEKQHIKTVSGTMDRVIAVDKKMYVWMNDAPVEIFYSDSLVVEDNEGKPATLNEIKRDSQISIIQDTFRETPIALKIVTAPQSSATQARGMFVGSDGRLITIKENSTLVTKFLADSATVEIAGMNGATTADLLKEADEVELTLNANDEVIKVKVVNRNVTQVVGAQIASFVYDKKLLTIVDANGVNAKALYITDQTKIEYSGNLISLASANSLLTQNRKIVISYTGSSIVSIQFVTKYVGSLVSMNSSANLMTVRLDNGTNVSVPYNSAYVEIAGATSSSFSDLKVGDMLTLELNNNQDRVATIKVHGSAQYEVVSIDALGKKLRVKNETTPLFDLSVVSTELLNEAGAALTIDQIKPGQMINASYLGRQAMTVKTVNVTYGRVQTVSANSVTIVNMTGQPIIYNNVGGFLVIEGAVQGSETSMLTAGDYVEVLKSDTNKTQFTVAVGENRVFTSYSASAGQVWTEKVTSNDNRNYFNVTSSTKYYQDGNAAVVTDFKPGDSITVYGFRNNALAIVKS